MKNQRILQCGNIRGFRAIIISKHKSKTKMCIALDASSCNNISVLFCVIARSLNHFNWPTLQQHHAQVGKAILLYVILQHNGLSCNLSTITDCYLPTCSTVLNTIYMQVYILHSKIEKLH